MQRAMILLAACALSCTHRPRVTELGTEWETPPSPYTAYINTIAPMPADCAGVAKPYGSGDQYGGVICSNICQPKNLNSGERFTDPSFGATMTALTNWQDGPWVHGYSLPSAFSTQMRWANLSGHDSHQNFDLFGATPYKGYAVPADGNAVIWDPRADDTYYYRDSTHHKILARSMRHNAEAVVVDFTGQLSSIETGGSTHMADNYLAVWSAPEHQVCAVNVLRQLSYCADYTAPHADSRVGWDFIDFTMVSPRDPTTGKQYVILAASPAIGLWAINEQTGRLDYEGRGPERTAANGFNDPTGNQDGVCDSGEPCLVAYHMDVALLSGRLWLLLAADLENPCERQLMLVPLLPLSRAWTDKKPLVPISLCSSQYEWPEMHFGCSRAGPCVISTASTNPAPYGNQILLLRDATHLTRLSYSYSKRGPTDTYWWYPRAAISSDGRYVLFDSTWGRPDQGTGLSNEQPFQIGPL